jgi:ABC-type amino acid transport substrate-binding protein
MRAGVLPLWCLLVIAAAFPAFPARADQNQDAVGVVREFASALASGNLERAASLITQDSVLFMSSATSIAPPATLKEKPKPVFFDQELTEAEAQGFKGVLDAMVLAGAVKIEPGPAGANAGGHQGARHGRDQARHLGDPAGRQAAR